MYLNPETYEKINRCVAEFLEDFGFTDFPLDPFLVFNVLGVTVLPYSALPPQERALALSASNDAFHLVGRYTDIESIVIAYNEQATVERIRFSLCHELAHIILEHESENSEWEESEADYCAGYLLVPDPVAITNNIYSVESIMYCFEVGYECARVSHDHIYNRRRCRVSWKDYEYALMHTCTVKGVGALDASN